MTSRVIRALKTPFPWVLAAVLLASSAFFRISFIIEKPNIVELVANDEQAWLFIQTTTLGYSYSYLELPGEMIREAIGGFGGVPTPVNRRPNAIAIRVTSTGGQSVVLDPPLLPPFLVFGGRIYDGRGDKWVGDKFERASDEEAREFHAATLGLDPFKSHEGWTSNNLIIGDSEKRFQIGVDGAPADLIVRTSRTEEAIEVRRTPNGPSEAVWHLTLDSSDVSAAQYKHAFAN